MYFKHNLVTRLEIEDVFHYSRAVGQNLNDYL